MDDTKRRHAQGPQSSEASLDPSLQRSFRGHRGAVNAVCFTPSMKQLVSSSDDHSVMVWNFKPQLRAFRFNGHTVSHRGHDNN